MCYRHCSMAFFMSATITVFILNQFSVYNDTICLNFIQVSKQFPIRAITRWKNFLYWHGHSGIALGAWRYAFLIFAFGGKRNHKRGKNNAILGWAVLCFFRVRVSPLVGQKRTVASLVGEVVVFTRPGPATGAGCSGGGVPQVGGGGEAA